MRVVYTLFLLLVFVLPAAAMQFDVGTWKGRQVVRATGAIVASDTKKLTAALKSVRATPYGAKLILLDSPGGQVGEALKISASLEGQIVHMIVPAGAKCASACASILFISGSYRTVAPGGLLGQHSCSRNGRPDAECNERIAQHAIGHGVSHGSVAAFVTYTAPDEILWFTRRDADCWGLSRYPFTRESGFEKSEPCAIRSITGREPEAQSSWRLDFLSNGYRAFQRPVADHARELELGLFCREDRPGRLFVSLDIAGPTETVRSAIVGAAIDAAPVLIRKGIYEVEQMDRSYSRVTVEIPRQRVLGLLTQSASLSMRLFLRRPYENIFANADLSGSRKTLIFAANHCVSE